MARQRRSIMAMRSGEYLSVLVVDDIKAMRTFLRTMLESDSVRFEEAGGLREARMIVRGAPHAPPDLVLLDLDLPDGNGLDLVTELPPATRVIALTADVDRETELLCQNAGCDLVIAKNRDLSSLREIVGGGSAIESKPRPRDASRGGRYVSFLAEALVELEDARRSQDILAVRRVAHRLRGTAIHFGYPGIGLAAKAVNSALRDGGVARLEAATSSLSERIIDALEAHHRKTRHLTNSEVSTCEFS